jgi:hypothetical protein
MKNTHQDLQQDLHIGGAVNIFLGSCAYASCVFNGVPACCFYIYLVY